MKTRDRNWLVELSELLETSGPANEIEGNYLTEIMIRMTGTDVPAGKKP